MQKISGSCLCGSIRYIAKGELRDVIACHCNECRKSSGHFTAATSVKPSDLEIKADHNLKWYASSTTAQRGFCQNCGSPLFFKTNDGDRISIFAGSIDGDSNISLTSHIYLEEKGDYYEVNDDTKKFMVGGIKLSMSD